MVVAAFAEFGADISVNVPEFLFTESSYLASFYVQYIICDFGLEIL